MAEYIKRTSVHSIIEQTGTLTFTRSKMHKQVDSLPTADVVPVIRGSWNLLRHDRFSDVFQCSECGRKVSLTRGRDVLEQFPYCHCGAKMEDAPCPEHRP